MTDETPTPADHPTMMSPDEETALEMSRMFGRIARNLAVFLVVLALLAVPLGWIVAESRGVWAAVLGVVITLAFVVSTAVLGRVTATQPTWVASAALLGVWIFKMVIVLVVIVAVRGKDFFHPLVLFATVVVAVIGSTVIEVREAARARVLNVAPKGQ